MVSSSKTFAKSAAKKLPGTGTRVRHTRKKNHLKDEVYREMLLLEMKRPGSEMGLALALVRAIAESNSFTDDAGFGEWLRTVCPVGLQMIEEALGERFSCDFEPM